MERERFGPYRLDGLLGRGGMGEVHRAHDTVRDRAVALKLLPAALVHDSGFQARFRREARVAARLREPHVVPIHDWGEIDGRLFLDMRLVEGEDLGALLARHGALPAARAVEIVSQVAGALDAAHADGLVHRDVKPSNVLLTTHDDRDFAYLCDFGIASARGEATVLTASGVTLGTLAYMAPEQFLGAGVDHRADVYSLACLLHEALTGARPFAATSAPALMHAHLYLPPAPPSHVRAGLPAGLDAVVGRGMAKEPTDRHPSAGALAAAARAALHPGGAPVAPPTAPRLPLPAAAPTWTPPPAAPPVPRRNRVPWLVVGAAAAAVFTLVAAVALVGGPGDRPVATSPTGPVTPGPSSPAGPATAGGLPPAGPTPPGRSPAPAVPSGRAPGPVPIGGDPFGIAVAPDGRRVYVADTSGTLSVIDTTTDAPPATVELGGALLGIAVSADGRRAYLTRMDAEASVLVVDTAGPSVVGSIALGGEGTPWDIDLAPDGRLAYVTRRGTGTVTVIDTVAGAAGPTITVSPGPADSPVEVALSPDGRHAYLTNRGSASVSVLDTATRTVTATVQVGGGPNGVAVAPDGRRVYVTNEGSDTVSVVDAASNAVTATIPVLDAPITVVVARDGRRAYVVDRGSKAVSVLDTTTDAVVGTLPLGGDPGALALSPDGRYLYVNNGETDAVSVVATG